MITRNDHQCTVSLAEKTRDKVKVLCNCGHGWIATIKHITSENDGIDFVLRYRLEQPIQKQNMLVRS
jgi:hypothetical protein